jgi:hypothetical protein
MTTADQVSAEALATEAADARAGNQALNDNPNPQSPAIEPGSSHQEPAQTEITSERKPYVSPRDAIIARVKAKPRGRSGERQRHGDGRERDLRSAVPKAAGESSWQPR